MSTADQVAMSPGQRRTLALQRVRPHVPLHVAGAFALHGVLEVDLLQRALRDVTADHPLLRARLSGDSHLEIDGGGPHGPALAVLALGGLPAAARRPELARLARRAVRDPFDLVAGPLVRALLIHVEAGEHLLVLTLHRLIADEASVRVLVEQLRGRYDALRPAGERRQATRRDGADAGMAHSTRGPTTPTSDVGADHGTVTAGSAAAVGTADGLAAVAAAADRDITDVVVAGVLAALSRLSGRATVALTVRDRRDRGSAAPIGPAEPTPVLCVDVPISTPFATLVGEVGRQRDELRADDAAMPPDVQAGTAGVGGLALVIDHRGPATPSRTDRSPLRWADADIDVTPPADELVVHVAVSPAGLHVRAHSGGGGLDRRLPAATLPYALAALLTAAASDPSRAVGALPLLSGADRHRLVVERNRTAGPYPRARLLHQLVEDQVLRTPDAPAVVCGLTRLTYAELDRRADRLACHLHATGVRDGALVGIAAERSGDVVVGLLAILKAGGAYVPLDTREPEARLRFLLDDAGVAVVLAGRATARRMPLDGRTLVRMDTPQAWDGEPQRERASGSHPDQLAYMIYTSGSTGQPKGVLVAHRQIVNSTSARWGFGRRDPESYLLLVPVTFDAAAQGLYWTLCRGGQLVIPNDHQIRDTALLANLIAAERITHLNWVPSQYRVLLEHAGTSLRSLRDVSLGGEALPARVVAAHHRAVPDAELYNDYGPTETTVWSTAHRCTPGVAGMVPIGRPIQNTRVYLLDAALEPVPDGCAGHLHIAGDGVTLGYHRRPDLTAERFVPNPFAERPGERLYRTGDLARYGPDGQLTFVGRIDDQVKVRGHRVELGEVEAALLDHPDVGDVAVVAQRRADASTLVAHVVQRAGAATPTDVLVAFVRERLPAHMVPTHVVAVDRLPRTAHGKVDRAALTVTGDGDRPGRSDALDDLSGAEIDRLLHALLVDDEGRP